jgi:hypothetical protein
VIHETARSATQDRGQYQRAVWTYRPSTRSNGALSRNSSGRLKDSLGTLRRLARSLSTLSMPLSAADLHRLDVQAFFGEEARVLGDPDGQMGDGRRSAIVNAPQLLPGGRLWAKSAIPKNVIQKMADWIFK